MSDDKGKTYTEDEIRQMNKDAQKSTGPDLRKVHPPAEPKTVKETPTPTPAGSTKS